jgi:hypothetical protein
VGNIFPLYGLTSPERDMKTTKRRTDMPEREIAYELQNKSKDFFK